MCEAPSENRINIAAIESVVAYNIIFSLILDASLVRERGIGHESLGLEKYDNFSIPRVK